MIPGLVSGQDVASARSEAKSLFDGAREHLANLDDYDVIVRVEENVIVKELFIPSVVTHWRLRLDRSNQFFFFGFLEKKLDIENGVEGELDKWSVWASVRVVEGNKMSMYTVGGRTTSTTRPSFEEAMADLERPRFDYAGMGEFVRSCLFPQEMEFGLGRAVASSDQLTVSTSKDQSNVLVTSVFNGSRMLESHQWQFRTDSYCPAVYIIKQTPPALSESIVILNQKVAWEEHPKVGWVPVSCESSQPIRLRMRSKNGEEYTQAERLTDVSLIWKDPNEEAAASALIKAEYSLADIKEVVNHESASAK